MPEMGGAYVHRRVACHGKVSCLAWRPTLVTMLAAGASEGVVLWSLGSQPVGSSGFQRQKGCSGNAWATVLKFRSRARYC